MMDTPVSFVRPYKGDHSFADTHDDRMLFFGREDEARMLVNVVTAERLSVLYARSGLGKTSLINARLLEGLRDAGYFPAAVRLAQDREGDPLRSLYLGLESEAQRQGVAIAAGNRDSLWQYFSETRFTKNGKPLRPVLVLDHFEDLFTVVRGKSGENFETFVGQLADLVRGRMPPETRAAALKRLEEIPENDPERKLLGDRVYGDNAPDIKVLLSFREDFLPEMETLQDRMPGIFRNVVRLRPLSRKNAEAAITQPGQAKEILGEDNTFTFEPAAIKELLDFLSTQLKGKRVIAGEEIEPVHLQLLCDALDRRRRTKKEGEARLITVADLGGTRGMTRILERYYQSVLKHFPWIRLGWSTRGWRPSTTNLLAVHFPRRAIRKLCEKGLITPSRRRNIIMADDVKRQFGIDDATLASLVKERLLRCEPRLGSEFYELAHDSLVAPLASARRRRRIWSAALFVALIAVPYALLVANALINVHRYEVQEQAKQKERKQALATLSREDAGAKERDKAFARLVAATSELTNQQFRLINFERGRINKADFSGSNLHGARFDGTFFNDVKFVGANLSRSSLVAAQFIKVDFTEAKLVGANFRGADLTDSTFWKADLRNAVLAEAAFSNARMDGALNVDSADFKEAEWWLAIGWTPDQMREFERRWPHRKIAATARYRNAIESRISAVTNALPGLEQADHLNDLAWHRAIHGTDLEQALREASEAVEILGSSGRTPSLDLALDTLGYIQLQLGQNKEAPDTFSRISWDRTSTPAEMFYRYGVALSRVGRNSEAQRYFYLAKQKKYEPTHELLLAPLKAAP
jgi:uncharacterized protein YjbI with pentapeptide repeats